MSAIHLMTKVMSVLTDGIKSGGMKWIIIKIKLNKRIKNNFLEVIK